MKLPSAHPYKIKNIPVTKRNRPATKRAEKQKLQEEQIGDRKSRFKPATGAAFRPGTGRADLDQTQEGQRSDQQQATDAATGRAATAAPPQTRPRQLLTPDPTGKTARSVSLLSPREGGFLSLLITRPACPHNEICTGHRA